MKSMTAEEKLAHNNYFEIKKQEDGSHELSFHEYARYSAGIVLRDALPPESSEHTYNFIKRKLKEAHEKGETEELLKPEGFGIEKPANDFYDDSWG